MYVPSQLTTIHSSSCQHCRANSAPSQYGFVLPHASATEPIACFWITKRFALGAGKIYSFGWKLQNLAISARQNLAANLGVFGGIFE